MLHINNLTFRIAGRLLLNGAGAHIPAGARVGLVGRNGCGKTTLLKLIMGDYTPDEGHLGIHPRSRAGRLSQEAPDGDASLIECVLAADGERTALLDALKVSLEPLRLAEIHERLNAIDAHSAPARAAQILAGLGFPSEQHTQAVGTFSGGWRMRVALAAVLFSRPDFLLLDEPTNHLDLEATLWLEGHLATYPGTLLIVSHDRGLLDAVVNRVLHLEDGRLTTYSGNYTAFETARRERMDLQAKAYAKQIEQRRKIESFVERFRAKASKARQAQSRLKMLERMEVVLPVIEDHGVIFDFPDPDALSPPLITVENGSVGYNGQAVLKDLNFRIDTDDRIALLGANGNGKSTFAKLLTARLPVLGGRLCKSSRLRVGYFAQHQTEELNPAQTPLAHMAQVMEGVPETRMRAHLGRFGFGANHVVTRVSDLSGGEKARLLIALMSCERPHLMVLDEPTNHLDIDSREALISALNAYEGAVVLISHDPHLVEMVADRLWLIENGALHPFDGTMEDYKCRMLKDSRDVRRAGKDDVRSGPGGGGPARKEDRRAAAHERARLAPFRKAVEQAEQRVDCLASRRRDLEARLSDPALYAGSSDQLTDIQQTLGEIIKDLAVAEGIWIEAMEAYETARATGKEIMSDP